MSDFKTVPLTATVLDPHKRVHYTQGLVLGVDEFQQEQTYFLERDRLHNRALHGYGTAYGLQVTVREAGGAGPEVVVSAGLAVDPNGQPICVPQAQCARLEAWLEREEAAVRRRFGSPPGPLTAYVVLCYRECTTDQLPVPGGPCRSQADSMVASRIADDFELRLTFDPPRQPAEEAARRLGSLLARIVVTDTPGAFLTEEELLHLVRGLAVAPASPPLDLPVESPPTSPPEAPASLRLHPAEAPDLLRALLRVWVTEVQPLLVRENPCEVPGHREACVLLAELQFSIDEVDDVFVVAAGEGDEPAVRLREDERPYLLTTRLLQEGLLWGHAGGGAAGAPRTFATLFRVDAQTLRAWIHHPVLLEVPAEAVTVEVDEGPVGSPPGSVTVTQVAPALNVFDLAFPAALPATGRLEARFDARLILEDALPPRPLAEALEEAGYAYVDREGETLLAYLVLEQTAALALDDLVDVDTAGAGDGQVLTRQGDVWVAQPVPAADGITVEDVARQLPALPFVTITPDTLLLDDEERSGFRLWFHLNAGPTLEEDNVPALSPDPVDFLEVFGETASGTPAASPFLQPLDVQRLAQVERNVFFAQVEAAVEFRYLRFRFDLEQMRLEDGTALIEWVGRRPMKWEGHDGRAHVTAFHENVPPDRGGTGYRLVAAGNFGVEGGEPQYGFGSGLRAERGDSEAGAFYVLNFDGYAPDNNYIVKGTPLDERSDDLPFPRLLSFTVTFPFADEGIVVQLINSQGFGAPNGFMVEIHEVTG